MLFAAFFYIIDLTYLINNIIYCCRHLEIIQEQYEYLNSQALTELRQYSFQPVI